MDSKDIVERAIQFGYPERAPLFFRNDPQRSDIVQVDYVSPIGLQPDEWGCYWGNIIGTGVGQVIDSPLEDWAALDEYIFPDPYLPQRFTLIDNAVTDYPDKFIVGSVGLSGFSRMMVLRGLENVLVDIALSEPHLARMMDGVFNFERGILEEFAHRKVHAAWFFDDWGTEHALMIRPHTWRKLFKPYYADQFRYAHSLGLKVFFHSCGYVWDIIPDLIEIGVDVLNFEQFLVFSTPEENGIDRLARNFAGRVCFCVNVDSQRTLINGSRKDIEEEVKHLLQAFNQPEGGLICFLDAARDHNIVCLDQLNYAEEAFLKYNKPL